MQISHWFTAVFVMFIERKRKRSALHTPKNPKSNATTQNATKNFDYTTIADRLRKVNWSNDSHPTGVVKPVYGIHTFPITTTVVLSKGHRFTWRVRVEDVTKHDYCSRMFNILIPIFELSLLTQVLTFMVVFFHFLVVNIFLTYFVTWTWW